jgi:drug/metabolite transporter (DMT)-like permease
MHTHTHSRTLAALAIVILFWSSAFAGIRAALEHYTPGHLVLLRFLAASTILAVYAILTRMRLPEKRDIAPVMLLGIIGITFYHVPLTFGEVSVTAGAASLIIGAVPIFTAILSTIILGERLSLWGWAGIGISFTGLVLIILGEGAAVSFNPDALLILFAAISTSTYVVLQKPLLQRYTALELVTYFIWVGTFFMLIFLPGLGSEIIQAPPSATLAVIYLGVFPAALAYVLWSYALSQAPASIVTTAIYLIPVFATLIAWVWLGEIPTIVSLGGGIIVLLGVGLVTTHGRRRFSSTQCHQGKRLSKL